MRQGLLALLLAQLFLFLAAWLAWLGLNAEPSLLPVLDRVVALFSLVLITWLWAFPKRKPLADGIFLFVEASILIAGIISLAWWSSQAESQFFNSSILGGYAYYVGIALSAAGILILFWQRPDAWVLGVSMLVILLGGYLAQYLIQQPSGDYAWLVRVGEMVSFIILLELPKRIGLDSSQLIEVGKARTSPSNLLGDKLIQEILCLRDEVSLEGFFLALSQLVARGMGAEACLLVTPPNSGSQLIVLGGYNTQNGSVIEGFTVDGSKMPSVMASIKTGQILCMNDTKQSTEAHELTNELGFKQTGQLMVIPFKMTGTHAKLGILVLSKPSQPSWSEADGTRLVEVTSQLTSLFPQPEMRIHPQEKGETGNGEIQITPGEAVSQSQTHEPLSVESMQVSPPSGSANGINLPSTWIKDQRSMQDTIQQLENRNHELEQLIARGRPSIEEVEQLREELRAALTDLARIPSALSKSDQKMLELQLSTMKRLDAIGQKELVTSIAQEFRQPLSSILGYSDLLLGESVGILGAVQRKFLERVKASTERLGILLNELVQVMTIDTDTIDQTLNMVELETVVDEAVGNIIAQISEKNITMRVDLPERLPEIQANREALQQILANLLENACIVTPENGEVRLFTRVEQKESEPDLLHISVTDQGEGINQADLPRVFTRRYKSENPFIQGIGDTGVGLSIVKSLVELHKGRVWVDTQEGLGSTFSILIPLLIKQPENTCTSNKLSTSP
jgi:signal transduction histidine kinase